MKKNSEKLAGRKALVSMTINDPKEGAKYMELAALSLYQANGTEQVLRILADVLFLDIRTLYNDIKS